jgi:hypothetical protein
MMEKMQDKKLRNLRRTQRGGEKTPLNSLRSNAVLSVLCGGY